MNPGTLQDFVGAAPFVCAASVVCAATTALSSGLIRQTLALLERIFTSSMTTSGTATPMIQRGGASPGGEVWGGEASGVNPSGGAGGASFQQSSHPSLKMELSEDHWITAVGRHLSVRARSGAELLQIDSHSVQQPSTSKESTLRGTAGTPVTVHVCELPYADGQLGITTHSPPEVRTHGPDTSTALATGSASAISASATSEVGCRRLRVNQKDAQIARA